MKNEKQDCNCQNYAEVIERLTRLECNQKQNTLKIEKIEKLAVELYNKAKRKAEELHEKSEHNFKQLEPFLWQKRKPIILKIFHKLISWGIAWNILIYIITVSLIDTYNSKWVQYNHLKDNLLTLLIELIRFLQKF